MQGHMPQQDVINDAAIGSTSQFLTFMLDDEVYGINILNIREIIEYGNITRVPMMPEFIAGDRKSVV